jgi:hypothetical protein
VERPLSSESAQRVVLGSALFDNSLIRGQPMIPEPELEVIYDGENRPLQRATGASADES